MRQIEQQAEAILASVPEWIWNGERLPIPVEDIADSCFSLLVRDEEDLSKAPGAPELPTDQTLSGLLLPARGEIWVNADEARQWPARRRFTIGHELGHWCLHRKGQEALFCRSTSVDEQATTKPARPVPEEEANAFSAALLMPMHLIQAHYHRVGRDRQRMCELFDCSNAAMERRLLTLAAKLSAS